MAGNRVQIAVRDAVVAYVIAWLFGNLAAGSVLAASGADGVAEAGAWWLAAISAAQWLPFLVALWVLSRRVGSGDVRADFGLSFRAIDLLGIPLGVAAQLVLVPLLYAPLESLWPNTFASDDVEKRARDLWESATGGGTIVLLLVVVVGAPLVEELVYRGLLQRSAADRWPHWRGWLAVVVVAALFALVHFAPVEYPGLFLVGVVFGACALRTRRLGMAVLTHAAFNAAGLALVAA